MKPAGPTKVIKAVPATDRNDLYHTTDGYDFIYENSAYAKIDVAKPGFFNAYRDELRVGMMVECRLGEIADGITQVFVQVIAAPRSERLGDIEVSVGSARKLTPCRHDGMFAEDAEQAA